MPGDWPLLDAFAEAELIEMQSANLPHRAIVETVDASDVWAVAASNVPCRLMNVSAMSRPAAGQLLYPSATSLVAFAASSPHAGPRRRLTVSGTRPDGTAFVARQLYVLGAHVPHVEESEAVVECREDPIAAGA